MLDMEESAQRTCSCGSESTFRRSQGWADGHPRGWTAGLHADPTGTGQSQRPRQRGRAGPAPSGPSLTNGDTEGRLVPSSASCAGAGRERCGDGKCPMTGSRAGDRGARLTHGPVSALLSLGLARPLSRFQEAGLGSRAFDTHRPSRSQGPTRGNGRDVGKSVTPGTLSQDIRVFAPREILIGECSPHELPLPGSYRPHSHIPLAEACLRALQGPGPKGSVPVLSQAPVE